MTNEEAFLGGIVEIANSPKLKAKGNPIKKWMVVRVLTAHKLFVDEMEREYSSSCHHTPVRIEGGEDEPDEGGTRYFVCTKCNKPCNPFEAEKSGEKDG